MLLQREFLLQCEERSFFLLGANCLFGFAIRLSMVLLTECSRLSVFDLLNLIKCLEPSVEMAIILLHHRYDTVCTLSISCLIIESSAVYACDIYWIVPLEVKEVAM